VNTCKLKSDIGFDQIMPRTLLASDGLHEGSASGGPRAVYEGPLRTLINQNFKKRSVCVCVCIYIYIYIVREGGREIERARRGNESK
jgi:hypothetical protein